jgi:hypothetical protein
MSRPYMAGEEPDRVPIPVAVPRSHFVRELGDIGVKVCRCHPREDGALNVRVDVRETPWMLMKTGDCVKPM